MGHESPTVSLDDLPEGAERYPDDAWELLSSSLTPARRAKMERVATSRTRHVRLVVQDVHDPHNISACLRSAEAFGVHHIDVVTEPGKFRASTAARGVASWLAVHRHASIAACATHLKAQGYRIAAGYPREDALALWDLPVDQPIAAVFGNEHAGIASAWDQHIDIAFTIPMVGFVESLNISVGAAITMAHLTRAARLHLGERYYLDSSQRRGVLNAFACRQTRSYETRLAEIRMRDLRQP